MSDPGRAVFLSYASQDAGAARRMANALRSAGIEVWFDQSELVGGDAWDAKIRKQIKDCALFVPVISVNTQARTEGYFRLEWRLADQRTHLMAKGRAFLLPVVIDDTRDAEAHVPDSFLDVQWTRLSGGETPTAFCERVKNLLGGFEMETGRPRPVQRGEGAASPFKQHGRGRWLLPAVAALVVAVALGVWEPWKKNVPPETKSAAPLTEAEKLIARMWAIYDNIDDTSPDEWVLAEELGAQATKLEPQNAEAWAAYSGVTAMRYVFGYVLDRAQVDRALKMAQRAVTLAPDSTNAQVALANCFRFGVESTAAEAERIIRALAERESSNRRVLRMAGNVIKQRGKYDEALTYFDRAIALPGRDHLTMLSKESLLKWAGRFAEAERVLDASFALHPGPRASARKLFYLIRLHDDLDAAAELITKVPGYFLQRDEGATSASALWLWRHETDKCIEVLRRFDGDELYGTPTGLLIGQAYASAGQPAAAQVEWRAALRKIDGKLAAQPNDAGRIYGKALLLACLGEKPEAERLLQTYLQMTSPGGNKLSFTEVAILVPLGHLDEALGLIEEGAQLPPSVNRIEWASLVRHDPIYDPLRNLPRFQAVLAKLNAGLVRNAAAAVKVDDKSIAVLAFDNRSDDKSNEYFSDGISEELLNVLAKAPGLKVSARTSAFHFKGKDTPIPEIARQLGVAYVVEGSVRKDGNRVRIAAQLIKAADGFHVWSDNFDRELKDIFALQDEIAGLIAKNLSLKLGASAPARPIDPEVFRLYLEGRQEWNRWSSDSLTKAQALFEQAIALAPNFARAHAGLADVWVIRAISISEQFDQRAEQLSRARQGVDRALTLDPDLADAHATLGLLLEPQRRQNDAAVAAFERALTLNPNYATAHQWYGRLLFNLGKIEAGIAELELAARLDPLSPIVASNHGLLLGTARRWKEALAACERALTIRPDFSQTLNWKTAALIAMDRQSEALAILRSMDDAVAGSTPYNRVFFIFHLARTGDRAKAEELAKPILANPSKFSPATVFHLYVALNRVEEAFAFWERSDHKRAEGTDFFMLPVFDRVRDDPRFVRLLEKAGILADYQKAWAHVVAWQKQSRQP